MDWRKLGLLLEPPATGGWCSSHLMMPFAAPSDPLLIWFSARDERGRSQTGRVRLRLDPEDPRPDFESEPVLELGQRGAFDDAGAIGSCVVEHEGRTYLYYVGMSLGVSVPFYSFIGCAVSDDGDSFEKISEAPIVGRSSVDPLLAAGPWVIADEGTWRMWYSSGTSWDLDESGDPLHRYHVKYAESDDGIDWRPTGTVSVEYAGDEHALARPCVIRDPDRYRMWFSHRGDAYRIGYAESGDGIRWRRGAGEAELERSEEGWDSEMIEYGFVFDHEGERYMLYNGNEYGRTGIGLAVLDR